ncbi:MAG: hypothetical protein DDT30_00701 [Dehalococcoidia bacterium]|nr:hypothetical protein [Bacillota bacterium]
MFHLSIREQAQRDHGVVRDTAHGSNVADIHRQGFPSQITPGGCLQGEVYILDQNIGSAELHQTFALPGRSICQGRSVPGHQL